MVRFDTELPSCACLRLSTLSYQHASVPRNDAYLYQLVIHKPRRDVHAGVPVPIFGVHVLRERFQQRHHVDGARLKTVHRMYPAMSREFDEIRWGWVRGMNTTERSTAYSRQRGRSWGGPGVLGDTERGEEGVPILMLGRSLGGRTNEHGGMVAGGTINTRIGNGRGYGKRRRNGAGGG